MDFSMGAQIAYGVLSIIVIGLTFYFLVPSRSRFAPPKPAENDEPGETNSVTIIQPEGGGQSDVSTD